MRRTIHIFILCVMAALATIAPATVWAQESSSPRIQYHGDFEMVGEFARDGQRLISSSSMAGDDGYFKIMPGDNVRIDAIRAGDAIILDEWRMQIQRFDTRNANQGEITGVVRFKIGERVFEGRVQVQQATCQSIRQPIGTNLFEGCYKYELKGTLRFVEVPADAAQI